MGYENITRKETVNNNITREESNVIYLKFIYDNNGSIIRISDSKLSSSNDIVIQHF